jgi:predicted ester cyclase
MTLRDYRDLIEGGIAAIPDLRFDVHFVVADGERIAARLRFDCTLAGEFLGLRPDGQRRVSFAEHVFYGLRDGRIEEVWALIGRAAIEAQLAA